jgi:hypothetical protein
MKREIKKHRNEFIDQGYTILSNLFNKETIVKWREIATARHKGHFTKKLHGNFFKTDTDLAFTTVSNPYVLNFLEDVWGPFIQLNSLTLVTAPPIGNYKVDRENGISWHRDPYSYIPSSTNYEKPFGINMLIYLQDLNDTNGPLRVIPKTHRKPFTIANAERFIPHVREELIYMQMGDAIIFHTNLVHSRSPNCSEGLRSYLSVFYDLSILKFQLNVDYKQIEKKICNSGLDHDRRILRLFGIDDKLQERTNWGGMEEERTFWNEWIEEDKNAATNEKLPLTITLQQALNKK